MLEQLGLGFFPIRCNPVNPIFDLLGPVVSTVPIRQQIAAKWLLAESLGATIAQRRVGYSGMVIRRRDGLLHEEITRSVIGAFYVVHKEFGFGLMESSYVGALEQELRARGHTVQREVSVRVYYEGKPIGWQRIDLLVDGKVVVECKATALLPATSGRQLYAYLKNTTLEVGLLLHFGLKASYYRIYSPNRDEDSGSAGGSRELHQ